jgi:hypothetical protein
MPAFDGVEITVGGQATALRFGLKSLMKLDNELGEKHGLKESILAPVTLDVGDGQRWHTTRLTEWLSDMSPGYMLRWAQFVYAGVIHLGRYADFDAFLDAITEEELGAAVARMAEVLREQLSSGAAKQEGAAAASPLSPEINSGSTSGHSAEST